MLKGRHRLRMVENTVLLSIFEAKRDVVAGKVEKTA
jgi:hypothetical protein